MEKLVFFYSAMDAGKTTHLLQQYHNLNKKNIKTLIFIPEIAEKNGIIKSRIGLKSKGIPIKENFNLFKYIKNNYKNIKYILIDEAQFLKKKQIFELISIVDILKISVLTYGLRTNFKSKLFEGSKYLLSFSDELIEIKTLCFCGKNAIMNIKLDHNKKKTTRGKIVEINKNMYLSVCRYHYYKKI